MSSSQVEAAIRHAIGMDPNVNMHDIQIRVVEGLATLTGVVPTLKEKESAGWAAARTAGVRQLENRLTVSANHPLSDRALNEELDTALDALPDEEHRTVGAVTADGATRLVGHARSAADIEAAREVVARMPGVKAITEEVRIDADMPTDESRVGT
jgi:hyperosmotically inducible periplasmic protein